MDYSKEDILVEISTDDLKQLANLYENHKDKLPHLHSFFQLCLKSKKIGMTDYVRVYSPRNSWSEDGSFIASLSNYGHDIIMHSLDPSGKNLKDGLLKTRRFTYNYDPAREYTLFYAVHEEFFPKIKEVLFQLKKNRCMIDATHLWCLKKENAIQFFNDPPNDVYIKEIEAIDIPKIIANWPNSYPAAEQKFFQYLKLGKGYGVYLKSNNKLLSWVMISPLGQMTALQTLEEHTKKGYASLAVKAMSKQLAEDGFDSCGTVNIENVASEALFNKLGFKKLYTVYYVGISNEQQ